MNSSDDLIKKYNYFLELNLPPEKAIEQLDKDGCQPFECIIVLMNIYDLSLSEARVVIQNYAKD